MNEMSTQVLSDAAVSQRLLPLAMAAMLGLFIIMTAGFSRSDVLHNAAHDYRHSMGFPCH
jgi:cobalt transporter subunit CbtB